MLTLHITHNDLDGVGCGILIKKFLPGTITTAFIGYDDLDAYIFENMHSYDRIIISDISPSFGDVEMLAGEKDVVIIDHHASSERLKEFPFTVHDNSKCATLLTYEWLEQQGFNVAPYKEFALCVNDIDLWKLKREDSLKMGILFNTLGIERFEKRFREEPYDGFNYTEALLIDLEDERKAAYMKKAVRNLVTVKDFRGLNAAIVFAESYASELGHEIMRDGTIDYVVLINAQQRKVSMRSSPEVDIRIIAEASGGGGHKNASGFSIKEEDFNLPNILKKAGIIK